MGSKFKKHIHKKHTQVYKELTESIFVVEYVQKCIQNSSRVIKNI